MSGYLNLPVKPATRNAVQKNPESSHPRVDVSQSDFSNSNNRKSDLEKLREKNSEKRARLFDLVTEETSESDLSRETFTTEKNRQTLAHRLASVAITTQQDPSRSSVTGVVYTSENTRQHIMTLREIIMSVEDTDTFTDLSTVKSKMKSYFSDGYLDSLGEPDVRRLIQGRLTQELDVAYRNAQVFALEPFQGRTRALDYHEQLKKLTEGLPAEWRNLNAGETQQWTHPQTGEQLIVARVTMYGSETVVAMKSIAGDNTWRVVDSQTGRPIFNSVDFDTVDGYVHRDSGAVAGGNNPPVEVKYNVPNAPNQLFQSTETYQVAEYHRAPKRKAMAMDELRKFNEEVSFPFSETTFTGRQTSVQVLRWISSTALALNKRDLRSASRSVKEQQGTPEIQSALIDKKVMIGTNAKDDSKIPSLLRNFFQTPPRDQQS